MERAYHSWSSPALERTMELLVFGHAGLPVLVFPTSCGRFYDFENHGMVQAVHSKIESGDVQLFCVDSIDSESWYAKGKPGRERIERHLAYERYLLDEVLPLIVSKNSSPLRATAGCGFGGFHATNISLRHPDLFTAVLSLGGRFDPSHLLDGYTDEDVYLNQPMEYMPNLSDPRYLDKIRHNSFVFATGMHDECWDSNEKMSAVLRRKAIPVRLDVWQDDAGHDWPFWQKMLAAYL